MGPSDSIKLTASSFSIVLHSLDAMGCGPSRYIDPLFSEKHSSRYEDDLFSYEDDLSSYEDDLTSHESEAYPVHRD